jgi:FixJ family two-component response regulator
MVLMRLPKGLLGGRMFLTNFGRLNERRRRYAHSQDRHEKSRGPDNVQRSAFCGWLRRHHRKTSVTLSPHENLGSNLARDAECVITDVQMPRMTGIDLQDRLLADGYRRPIIFMSAQSLEDTGARASRIAASRFLKKPFSDEGLIDCLNWALKDRAPNRRS